MAAMSSKATHAAAGSGTAAPSSHVAAASIENAVAAAASDSLTSNASADNGSDNDDEGKTMPATSATVDESEAALAARRGLESTRLRTAANMVARASARCCRAALMMAALVALVALAKDKAAAASAA